MTVPRVLQRSLLVSLGAGLGGFLLLPIAALVPLTLVWFGMGEDQTKLLGTLNAQERAKAYVISADDLAKQNPTQYAQLYNSLKAKLGRNPNKTDIENAYTTMVLLMKGN